MAMCKTDYGGGGVNVPKIDYVICERPLISPGVMSPKILLDCVQTEILVSENVKCKSLLDEATAYHLLPQVPVFNTLQLQNETYLIVEE